MNSSRIGAIIICFCSLLSFNTMAADIEAGKAKSAVCSACHGKDGNSSNPMWPSLAGQNAKYTVKQLMDFKSDARVNATMKGMAMGLSVKDMQNLAAFYESQSLNPISFNTDLIERGQDIYRGGITDAAVAACMGCHSPSAKGNKPAGWPSLKGQHPDYIVSQLKSFQSGERNNDEGSMMRNVTKRLSDREMAAVAAYLAGIQ
ncbi:MAG: cytochrome c553 [Gammaproteobacteria bacterium]|jgi:cytochrome c553